MRYSLILLLIVMFIGCDSQVVNAPNMEYQDVDIVSITDLEQIAKDIENYFSVNEFDRKSRDNIDISSRDSELLKKILLPLQKKGIDFKEKILENSSDSEKDYEILNSISDDELILVGLISLAIEGSDLNKINCDITRENLELTQNLDGDRVMACLGTATGYSSIKAIVDLNGLMSAKTLMETVKAVGKRYLGYVGAAVMVYSFARCMDLV